MCIRDRYQRRVRDHTKNLYSDNMKIILFVILFAIPAIIWTCRVQTCRFDNTNCSGNNGACITAELATGTCVPTGLGDSYSVDCNSGILTVYDQGTCSGTQANGRENQCVVNVASGRSFTANFETNSGANIQSWLSYLL
eukprot:TRINITY_DN469_c0_g1_i4.p1 TRINITY_DN469_c0_g1~~TRINITY_DN469_c0_g1_i4.p1  ORF type:complete len:139 (+),score=21.75 TRINITY_DN469_c0_g1_i4:33-449(+)